MRRHLVNCFIAFSAALIVGCATQPGGAAPPGSAASAPVSSVVPAKPSDVRSSAAAVLASLTQVRTQVGIALDAKLISSQVAQVIQDRANDVRSSVVAAEAVGNTDLRSAQGLLAAAQKSADALLQLLNERKGKP